MILKVLDLINIYDSFKMSLFGVGLMDIDPFEAAVSSTVLSTHGVVELDSEVLKVFDFLFVVVVGDVYRGNRGSVLVDRLGQSECKQSCNKIPFH